MEFWGGPAGFVEGSAVVVAGDLGEILVIDEVGPGHEAEAGASVKHVEVDSVAVAEDVVEVVELGLEGAGLVGVAPVVEPAGPVLGDEEGFVGLEGGELGISFLELPTAEVDSGEDAGDAAVGEFVAAVDGVEEGVGEAGADEDVAHVGHVGVIGIGGAVSCSTQLPYSFSTWVMRIGPPRPIWSEAVSLPSRLIQRSTGTMKAGSLVRRAVDMRGSLRSHAG